MSRLAKKPIPIPAGITVTVSEGVATVKGPAGTLSRRVSAAVSVSVGGEGVSVSLAREGGAAARSLLGTSAAHLRNMIAGAGKPFSKRLIVEGIGFRSEVKGDILTLSLGFSHPVVMPIPPGLAVTAEKNIVTVSGPDIEAVGEFAARVRARKLIEPYKGKGIRYENELVRRKQGKKATAAA